MTKTFKKMAMLIMALGLILQSCSEAKRTELGLQVETQEGILEGIQGEGIKLYLGVPFAQAPVGDLRWKAPQPVEKWEGIRQAKDFGPDPMQPNLFGDMNFRGNGRSEDCLYLNIWTPAVYTDEALPVLIYFNGGGLMAGSGSEPRYDGAALARLGVLTVTANYREGVFGFFAHPELTAETQYKGSGNYGFLDQVAAIQWVKDHIAQFGGDPGKINIVGESAGSFSVSVLMASPLSKDNLAGAMLSSGAELMPYGADALGTAEQAGVNLLASKNITSLAEARALSADSLQKLFPPRGMAQVVLDNYFMKEDPNEVFQKGQQARVPLLGGWNSQEGTPMQYLGGKEPNLANFAKGMEATFGQSTGEILKAYGIESDEDVFSLKAFNLAGDLFTGFPTWKCMDLHAQTSGQPVYRYKFMHPRPEASAKMDGKVGALAGGVREKTAEDIKQEELMKRFYQGAVHSADIEYAMGTLDTNEFYSWKEEDYAISKTFLSFYANFCKYGNPNGEGLPQWDSINDDREAAPVMYIDVETAQKGDPELENAYRTLDKFYLSRKN